MKNSLLASALLLIPLASPAYNIDIYLMGGPTVSELFNNSYVQINQYQLNKYRTHSKVQVEPLFGLGIAHTFDNLNLPVSLSLGLSGYYAYFGKVKGTEYPFINDGVYDSLNYQWHARTLSALVESRLAYTQHEWQPYAIVGVGGAWNRLSNYSEVPTIPSASAAASPHPFADHVRGSFAYEVGLGVQKQVYKDPRHQCLYFLSLDYRYMDFGKGKLNRQFAQISSKELQVSTLDTHVILLALKITG